MDIRKIYDDVSKRVPAEKLYEELYSGLIKRSKKNEGLDFIEFSRDCIQSSALGLQQSHFRYPSAP